MNKWGIVQIIDLDEMLEPFDHTMNNIFIVFIIGIFVIIAIILYNIRENMVIQKELKSEATTDYLTGIYNRKAFFELADYKIKKSKESLKEVALFMIDIDRFKNINDTYGHDVGDIVLKNVAQQMGKSVRNEDMLCRFGGDEFVYLHSNTNRESLLVIANRMLDEISKIVVYTDDAEIRISLSIGISVMGPEDSDLDTLIKQADVALYEAKAHGRNCIYLYDA